MWSPKYRLGCDFMQFKYFEIKCVSFRQYILVVCRSCKCVICIACIYLYYMYISESRWSQISILPYCTSYLRTVIYYRKSSNCYGSGCSEAATSRWGSPFFTFYKLIINEVCQWLAPGRWFILSTLVSSTIKTDCHDKTEILLKVVLSTINQTKLW